MQETINQLETLKDYYYGATVPFLAIPKPIRIYFIEKGVSANAERLYLTLRDMWRESLYNVIENGEAWIDGKGVYRVATNKKLAMYLKTSVRTMQRYMNELRECGVLLAEQPEKENGEANRIYLREHIIMEQLKNTDVSTVEPTYDKNDITPHDKNDTGTHDKNGTLLSTSFTKHYFTNIKDYVLSYIERHNFEIDDTLKEKIANNYKGVIMSLEEKNERLNCMIDTYIKNEEKLELGDTSEVAKNKRKKGVTRKGTGHSGSIGSKKKTTRKEITPDWFEEHREESEQPAKPKEATQEEIERLALILAKQKEEPQAPNPTLEPKKELIKTVTGYQEAIVMPKGAENPFLEVSAQKEGNYTIKEEKPYINENETFEDYNNMNPETPKLTGNQIFRISKLTKKANSGDAEAWRKCESLEMKRFVEIGERGRFKVKDDILTAM